MAQVKAFSVAGLEMWIPSGDHEPPHFHARKPGAWKAKVFFLEERNNMIKFVKPQGAVLRSPDRRKIIEGAERNRATLLAEWDACQGEG